VQPDEGALRDVTGGAGRGRGSGRPGGGARPPEAEVAAHERRSDVVELLKAGVDRVACRDWLVANASALVPRFDELAAQAEREGE
jgi:hypothetical protein